MTNFLAILALLPCVALAQPSPPPPSTGAEQPRGPAKRLPTPADAAVMLDKVLADALLPNRDCAKLISPWTRVLFATAKPAAEVMKKNLDAFLWLSRCAEKQRYFVLMGDLGEQMLKADPEHGHPELLARAMLGLNSPQMALAMLKKVEKTYEKDPDVALASSKVLCRTRAWADCLAAADKTLKLVLKPKEPAGKEILNRAQKYRARALLHLGKLEDATKAVALSEKLGGDAEDLTDVRKAMVPAKTYKAVVSVEHQPMVALGIFHLIGKRAGSKPLVRFFIDNIGEDRQFRFEALIEGVTTTQTKIETLLKGTSAQVDLTPQFAPGFEPATIRSERPAQLTLKVTAIGAKGEQVVFSGTEQLDLKPRDFLPTATFIDDERALNENHFAYIGAWVTPNHKSIESFLSEAKKLAPRQTFAGEQAATIPQVEAIFQTLKARGVSYVMNPEMLAGAGYGQRARLPSEVLTSTNAQCLEGAILYAALFEAIGLQPAIVIVPGHAFVAWRASPGDAIAPPVVDAGAPVVAADAGSDDAGAVDAGTTPDAGRPFVEVIRRPRAGQLMFLETTMTHDGTFISAVNTGMVEYVMANLYRNAQVLMLPDLRKIGIAPQPYE